MICPKCGAEIAEGSKFCTSCGCKIEAEPIKQETNIDFDENENTEIIFDKELPKDRLKKGSKMQNIITVVAFAVVIVVAGVVLFFNTQNNNKKLKELENTGIETSSDGRIVFNKGNKQYANDEVIEYNGYSYYFDKSDTMYKGDWVQVKNKWYYCKDDGKIAKNEWIKSKDGSQYYVDEYGEMLKNTRTPDGYLVDGEGKWVDEAALAAAEAAKKAAEEAARRAVTNTQNYSQQATTQYKKTNNTNLNIDTSKDVWIQTYDSFSDTYEYDDGTYVDISIKYPVFGGHDTNEASNMTLCLSECKDDMLSIASEKIDEEEKPKKYSITEANIANIESNKITVIMKGKLERSGKSARDAIIRFIYDRQSGTGFVKD